MAGFWKSEDDDSDIEESEYSSEENEKSTTEDIPVATAKSSNKMKQDEQFQPIIHIFDTNSGFQADPVGIDN